MRTPPEVKRKMLNVIIEEISCSGKRGEKIGEITYKLRGDGTVKKNWEDAVVVTKQNEESGNPHSRGLTPRVAWLRESHRDSNFYPCISRSNSSSQEGSEAIIIASGAVGQVSRTIRSGYQGTM